MEDMHRAPAQRMTLSPLCADAGRSASYPLSLLAREQRQVAGGAAAENPDRRCWRNRVGSGHLPRTEPFARHSGSQCHWSPLHDFEE